MYKIVMVLGNTNHIALNTYELEVLETSYSLREILKVAIKYLLALNSVTRLKN